MVKRRIQVQLVRGNVEPQGYELHPESLQHRVTLTFPVVQIGAYLCLVGVGPYERMFPDELDERRYPRMFFALEIVVLYPALVLPVAMRSLLACDERRKPDFQGRVSVHDFDGLGYRSAVVVVVQDCQGDLEETIVTVDVGGVLVIAEGPASRISWMVEIPCPIDYLAHRVVRKVREFDLLAFHRSKWPPAEVCDGFAAIRSFGAVATVVLDGPECRIHFGRSGASSATSAPSALLERLCCQDLHLDLVVTVYVAEHGRCLDVMAVVYHEAVNHLAVRATQQIQVAVIGADVHAHLLPGTRKVAGPEHVPAEERPCHLPAVDARPSCECG